VRIRDDITGRERLAIECLALAGLGDGEIASRLGLPADIVSACAALFFDVRPVLACPDLIVLSAIDPSANLRQGAACPEVVARPLSFFGGPPVAEAVLGLLANDLASSSARGVPSGRSDVAAGFSTPFALHATPVDERTAPRFLRLYARHLEIEVVESARSTSPLSVPVLAAPVDVASLVLPEAARENATDVPHEGLATDGREGMTVDPSSSMAAATSPGSLRDRLRRAI
jgi:hypothetical protein